ncbi:NADH dehydrogenase subunit 1 [Wolbachia pipientis wVitA]|nr:NADH dehydrogenase subunit 1 [Wolbachia pipientis wVitA]
MFLFILIFLGNNINKIRFYIIYIFFLFFIILIRGTFPRIRYDFLIYLT